MNPLTNVKNINKLNEIELSKGLVNKKSWHDLYKESAWIFIGGLAYGLTEGDILAVFSQYGEIVNINLVRDKKTGKIKGFCFLCYANQKSSILAVDNLNGIKLCNRTIRVDHVANYKPPKDNEQDDEITKMLKSEGCAPKPIQGENSTPIDEAVQKKKHKKHKKEKKKHKKRKREDPDEEFSLSKVKKEKVDEGYSKYEFPEKSQITSRKNETTESKSSDDSSESDFSHISRKEKHESHKPDRNHPNSDKKFRDPDKSRTNKNHIENSKHKPRKERGPSSESDRQSNRKRSPNVGDHTNGVSSERRDLKHHKYQSRDSSSDEERHKIDHGNPNSKKHHVRNSSSRHPQYDSSSGDGRDTYYKESSRTTSKHREKHGRRDSLERERNSYKDRGQQDPHSSYQDHRNKGSSHKTGHRRDERRDYGEKYEHKNRDNKREYGKHFELKER